MTEDMIDITDDAALAAALQSEVPARGDNYWASIDDRLRSASAVGTATGGGLVAEDKSLDITAAGNDDTGLSTRLLTHLRTWPVLAAAAALVLVAGLLAVQFLPSNGERVDAGFADGERVGALDDLPGPRQNRDHWHAVYGVWDCTANDGIGDWLPAFQSTEDDVGIHSHGEGLIYIHPFFEESAGRNATFSHFADAMNFTITDDAITLEDGTLLAEGAMCGGQPAELQLLRWQDARALEADPALAPRVITNSFGAERFYNDLEVWTVALAPAGADIPLPLQNRFDELAGWWWSDPENGAQVLLPTPVAGRSGFSFPPHNDYVSVGLLGEGADVDPVIEEMLASRPPGLPSQGEQELGSARWWAASAIQVRLNVEIVTYQTRDDAPGLAPTLTCWEVFDWGGGCSGSDDPRLAAPRLIPNTGGDIETVVLVGATDNARWLSLQLDDGHRIIADVVEGTSWAAWRADRGLWARVELLDLDHNVLWSDSK